MPRRVLYRAQADRHRQHGSDTPMHDRGYSIPDAAVTTAAGARQLALRENVTQTEQGVKVPFQCADARHVLGFIQNVVSIRNIIQSY